MKDITKLTLKEFEDYLRQAVKENPKTPFSTEEVIQILKSYNPPEDLEAFEDDTIVQVMKAEYQKRFQLEKKLNFFSRIHSLGELVQIYCDYHSISDTVLARFLGLSSEEFKDYQKDRIAPGSFKKEFLLNLAALVGISMNQMIQLLDKTFRLFQIKQSTSMAPSYTRMKKRQEDTSKMLVRDGAMKELLLRLTDEEVSEADEFDELKNELIDEYKKNKSDYENIGRCYTIRTKQQYNKVNEILQQL
jgi:hypothetical protein